LQFLIEQGLLERTPAAIRNGAADAEIFVVDEYLEAARIALDKLFLAIRIAFRSRSAVLLLRSAYSFIVSFNFEASGSELLADGGWQVVFHPLNRIEVTLADLQFACALGAHLARALIDSRGLAPDLVSINEDAAGRLRRPVRPRRAT
jgi:hypothetical protein